MDYKDFNAIGIVRLMLTDGVISVEQAAKYFPELGGSKDEEVRKGLISFLENHADSVYEEIGDVNAAIAWLEKRGENISLPKFTFDDVLALQSAMVVIKLEQEDKALYKQLESLHDRVHDAYWLEKQGEQKPTDLVAILKDYFANTPKEQREKDWEELKHLNEVGFDAEIAFGAKDSDLQEETYFIPDGFHAEIIGDKVVIKKGEQKPTEISNICEFSIKTWIKIVDYVLTEHNGIGNYLIDPKVKDTAEKLQKKYKFDAASEEWDRVYRKGLDAGVNKGRAEALREQKPTELAKGEDYGIDGLWHAISILERTRGKVYGYQTDDGILEHECAISAVKKLYEQKPWSEEDLYMQKQAIRCVNNSGKLEVSTEEIEDWLKSLSPQSTWSPSNEQIVALRWVLNHIPYDSHKEEINGLLEQLLKLYNYGENR